MAKCTNIGFYNGPDGDMDETQFDSANERELMELWWDFCKENNIIIYTDVVDDGASEEIPISSKAYSRVEDICWDAAVDAAMACKEKVTEVFGPNSFSRFDGNVEDVLCEAGLLPEARDILIFMLEDLGLRLRKKDDGGF